MLRSAEISKLRLKGQHKPKLCWPLSYLGLLSAEISFFYPPNLQILTSSCQQKTLKTWKCWTAIFRILKPHIHFFADASFFCLVSPLIVLFSSFSSCFFFFALASFFCFFDLEAKEEGKQRERKKKKKERKKERQRERKKERKERKAEKKKERKKERKEGKKGRKERRERKEGRKKGKKEREREKKG